MQASIAAEDIFPRNLKSYASFCGTVLLAVIQTNGTSLSIVVQSVLPTAASSSESNCPSPERSRAF